MSWKELTATVADGCRAGGIDLVQPLRVAWYNELVDDEFRLPDFGRADCLALCIGNTRAMWQPFIDSVQAAGELTANPIDDYVTRIIESALAPVEVAWEVRYAPEPPPRRVGLQKLAKASGLADLAPSYLCVHPVFGPWIGLRAAVVLDAAGPAERPEPVERACDCSTGCQPALERALAADGSVEDRWKVWVAVRDACPVGREHRYSERQIRYHYTKKRDLL